MKIKMVHERWSSGSLMTRLGYTRLSSCHRTTCLPGILCCYPFFHISRVKIYYYYFCLVTKSNTFVFKNLRRKKVFRVFWEVFRVFWGCSWFFGGVPGFSGVPEYSVMFRCSGVPCSGVPESTTCRVYFMCMV